MSNAVVTNDQAYRERWLDESAAIIDEVFPPATDETGIDEARVKLKKQLER